MGEYDVWPDGEELTEVDSLEVERRVMSFFDLAQSNARRLAEGRHETPEAAYNVAKGFVDSYNAVAAGTEGLAWTKVRVEGPDVKVSNIDARKDEESGQVVIGVDQDEPYVGATITDDLHGTCFALHAEVSVDERGYYPVPQIVLSNNQTIGTSIEVGGMPVAEMSIKTYIIAPLASSHVTIPEIEGYEAREAAISKIVFRDTGETSELPGILTQITGAIKRADDSSFTPYDNIEHFHRLAQVTDTEADVASVIDAMRDIFGKTCPVKLAGSLYRDEPSEDTAGRGVVQGYIVDILPSLEKLELNEPTIVVSSPVDGAEKLFYVPLSRIEGLSF
jgi:hypothetical protein